MTGRLSNLKEKRRTDPRIKEGIDARPVETDEEDEEEGRDPVKKPPRAPVEKYRLRFATFRKHAIPLWTLELNDGLSEDVVKSLVTSRISK